MPYCSTCDRQFQSERALQQHYTSPAHNLCTKCQLMFQTPGWRDHHEILVHHVCAECRRYFTTSEELESHSALCTASSGVSGHVMTDDLGDSLLTIRAHYKQPLVTLLRDIQLCREQSQKSVEFVRNLECLYLPTQSCIPDSTARPTESEGSRQPIIFTKRQIDAGWNRQYVALSYTWDSPLHSKETDSKYFVQPLNGGPQQSKVRGSVFERAQKYMAYFELQFLWIDRECIAQEDGERKEIAVQAMDLVYHLSNYPIGLLYQPILSIAELELLAGLMTGQFVEKSGPEFKLRSGPARRNACKILELLGAIVSDVWWTRAWTYQENYRGGIDMRLLIPHSVRSEDYRKAYVELFENIPGEIVLSSTRFHEAATAFCLAFNPPAGLMKVKELVLERVRKYTLILEKPDEFGRGLATKSMSPRIIEDIEKRQLKFPLDRLPIIANCCQYTVRLDSTELMKRGHSISLSILALFLLNGEILYNGRDNGVRGSGEQNITSFLNAQAFDRYSPPQSAHGLTYNKSCRFIDVELTKHGIETRGHLWKLGRRIETATFRRALPFVLDGGDLSRIERRTLMLLAEELHEMGYVRLYGDICEYLNDDDASRYGISSARRYKRHMASELAAAVRQGRTLQIATLWYPFGKSNPYYGDGIFICNPSGPDEPPDFVFTASCDEASGDRFLLDDIDRHVSLEVDCTFGNGGPPVLHTRRWIHGLCFYYECRRIEVTFPWPSTIMRI